jgi:hypothetical protein
MERWRAIGATATGGLQIGSLFLGIVVTWVMYATLVLRFAWVPRFTDLVFPFVIGLLEFLLAATLVPERAAAYLALLAVIFLVASGSTFGVYGVLVGEGTVPEAPLRRKLRSYFPAAAAVVTLFVCSGVTSAAGPGSTAAFVCMLAACTGLLAQLLTFRHYWVADLGR